jgi:glutaredoxin
MLINDMVSIIMKKVFMYTLSTCPWCRKAKQFFTKKGISFEFIEYDLAKESEQNRIRDEMLKNSDSAGFPYIKINGGVVVGYNPEKYEELLTS